MGGGGGVAGASPLLVPTLTLEEAFGKPVYPKSCFVRNFLLECSDVLVKLAAVYVDCQLSYCQPELYLRSSSTSMSVQDGRAL